jgi:hypothetical protein
VIGKELHASIIYVDIEMKTFLYLYNRYCVTNFKYEEMCMMFAVVIGDYYHYCLFYYNFAFTLLTI